jgi:four helix bundle protein
MNEEFKNNPVVNLSFGFALKILNYCEILESRKRFTLSNQLLRSGVSIGANIREAQNAESKADFIHKFKISAKEIEETEYWLLLCKSVEESDYPKELLFELEPIKKIVSKIIGTAKRSMT